MVKLYGVSDGDSLEVKVLKDPVSREIQYNVISHILYSERDEVIDLGGSRELDLDVGCQSDSERDTLIDFVFNKLARITFDDIKYMNAKYIGGSRNWAVTAITKLHSFTISLKISALLCSFVEHNKAGNEICANSGNHYSSPKFVVTPATSKTSFTISDGTRILTYTGNLINGDVLEIEFWKAFLNDAEVSQNLSGEYPRIPANQSTFVFTIVGLLSSEIAIKYRDTWR